MDAADISNLARQLDPGKLLTNLTELLTYEVDAANDRGLPDGVVFPSSADDVLYIVNWAAKHGVPLIARGAGTGLSGGAVAHQGGLILEFSRLNNILELDPKGRSVRVEPGVIHQYLDEYVRKAGLYFPPDPSSGRSATIGGNVGENAGGPHCFKYGVTTNYITAMQVVLADGQAVQLGGPALDVPEYDFIGVITGSEGTLGIVTQVSFRLLRYPPAVRTMMAAFDSVEAAGNAVSAVIARGLVPATLEFMDQKMMRIIEDYAHAGLPVEAGAALIVEVDGFSESLAPQMEEVAGIIRTFTRREIHEADNAERRERIWYGRKSAAGAMARLAPAYYLLDGTVPRSKLAETLSAINQACEELELRVSYVFHAGDGNLHPFILIEDPSNPELLSRAHAAGDRVMAVCLEQDGSITGEHGVGIEKRKYMPWMYSPAELSAMRDIKDVFDPQGILNPGKIFPDGVGETPGLPPAADFGSVSLVPISIADAAETVRAYAAAVQPLTLRGGGSKSGAGAARSEVLSTRGLSGIVKVSLEDLYVTAGAGTRLSELQDALESLGVWVPVVSPWPEATLGGVLAANFNAPLRMRYGALRDLLLACQVVLPDGRTIRAGRPVVKNVAGYDLPKLFVGSYGTLGLICEATFKLCPKPRAQSSLLIPVDDLHTGLEWGLGLLPVCLTASALLLCRGTPGWSAAAYTLIYTADGMSQDVETELAEARRVLRSLGVDRQMEIKPISGSQVWADWIRTGGNSNSPAWNAQHAASSGLARLGVAAGDLPQLARKQADILERTDLLADIANGLLYLRGPVILSALRETAQRLGGYAIQMNSGVSPAVEPWGYVPGSLDMMKKLKRKWDPAGRFNNGAFLV